MDAKQEHRTTFTPHTCRLGEACGTKIEVHCSCGFGQGADNPDHAATIANGHRAAPSAPCIDADGRDARGPCGNEDCDRCNPLPRWTISVHRIQHMTYTREIKAATREEAMTLFERGTAWPTSYDDRYGEIVQQDAPVVEQVTDEFRLRYFREDCCYHDLPTPAHEFTQEQVDNLLSGDD